MTAIRRSPSELALTFSLLESDHLTAEPSPSSSSSSSSSPQSTASTYQAASTRRSISSSPSIKHTHIWMPDYNKYLDVDQHTEKKGWTTHITWACSGPHPHIIQLEHGLIFGTRKISVNGQLMISDRKVLDDGSTHHLTLQGHDVVIRIITDKGSFHYQLTVDGQTAKEWQ